MQSKNNSIGLWETAAKKIPWFKQWTNSLEWNEPFAHWFAGGTLNASYACLDHHITNGLSEKKALIWESEDGNQTAYTYGQLHNKVNNCAHFLKNLGIKQGHYVVVYMPMIPETLIVILALARLGAIHVVVFSGFSGQALKDRIDDVAAQFVITADYTVRRGKKINLKAFVDEAVQSNTQIKHVIVVDRTGNGACMTHQHDVVYQDNAHDFYQIPAIPVESNHPLFVLYTSGTTGKPKGIVHSTGGYLTYCHSTFEQVFNPTPEDIYWCTADFGWITGHSYVIYAPLMHGLTVFLYEGTPDYPDAGIWWSLIEKYKITILYTSPTALRMAIKAGDAWPAKYNLSTLTKLGSVGEPINPEVWKWYYTQIGGSGCAIADTWWQTETGGFMIAPRADTPHEDLRPGSAGKPLMGIQPAVVDEHGTPKPTGQKGYLIIQEPWPGMCIGIHNDPEKFKAVYWSKFPGNYYTGDYAYQDAEDNFWLLGRADEVLNISGHRVGTAEIESASLHHPLLAEAAAIGKVDDIKGESVVLFATLKAGAAATATTHDELRALLRKHIGAFVQPSAIYYLKSLPKTRSGKIMRRLLKGVLEGKSLGDVSTLEDQGSLDDIRILYESLNKELGQTIDRP